MLPEVMRSEQCSSVTSPTVSYTRNASTQSIYINQPLYPLRRLPPPPPSRPLVVEPPRKSPPAAAGRPAADPAPELVGPAIQPARSNPPAPDPPPPGLAADSADRLAPDNGLARDCLSNSARISGSTTFEQSILVQSQGCLDLGNRNG
jgi:hypothetical protein